MEQHHHTEVKFSADILVVGAGIAGISTALEAAETGYSVILIEKNPNVGGRVVQLNEYFPKLCPPTCGMEINIRRLKDNSKINLITLATVDEINGEKGNYKVKIKEGPFIGFEGTISEIDPEHGKLIVLVNIFDRQTPVELEFDQVEKIS